MTTIVRLGIALVAFPTSAYAHSPVPGIEGFYLGLIHPISTPAQILTVLMVGLLIGQFPLDLYRRFFGAFFTSSLVGLILARLPIPLDEVLFVLAAGMGLFAALLPGRIAAAALILVTASGLMLGNASLADPGPTGAMVISTAGAIVGANLLVLYLVGMIEFAKDKLVGRMSWLPIGLRILSAWIAAIAAIMLALTISIPQ